MRDRVALAGHLVVVPAAHVDLLLQLGRVAELLDQLGLVVLADHHLLPPQGENSTVAFAVEDAGVLLVRGEVALVSANRPLAPFLGLFPTPVLHSRVAADQAELETQHEVVEFPLPPDAEFVVGERVFLARDARDRTVLDRPPFRVAVPAVERLAVENRLEARLVGGGKRRTGRDRQGGCQTGQPCREKGPRTPFHVFLLEESKVLNFPTRSPDAASEQPAILIQPERGRKADWESWGIREPRKPDGRAAARQTPTPPRRSTAEVAEGRKIAADNRLRRLPSLGQSSSLIRRLRNCTFIGGPGCICSAMMPRLQASLAWRSSTSHIK